MGDPPLEAVELRDADRGLQVRVFEVEAEYGVKVVAARASEPAALVLELPKAMIEVVRIGGDHAALAGRDRFIGREREAARVTKRAQRPAAVARAERLGGIAYEKEAVLGAQRRQGVVVRAAAVHVHRHDGLGARTDGGA